DVGDYFITDYREAQDVEKEAQFLLALGTGRMLESARVAPIEENGKHFAVIATGFSREAVFAQLMLRIIEGNPLRKCKRIDCPNVFSPGPHDKEYCQLKCQEINKRRRQLGKPKEEIERADISLMEGKPHAKRHNRSTQ